jgi:uncharacterized membrane protein
VAVATSESGVRWLHQQLPELVSKGVISGDAAAALRQHYGAPRAGGGVSLLVAATAVVGALLIGSGIILLLAANWDNFPRAVRTVFAFVPLLVSQALGAFVLLRKADSTGWRESAAILNSLAVAAAIALVGQIYHIPGNPSTFFLAWMLLVLPVVYLLRSAAATLLFLWLAMTWMMNDQTLRWPWGWLLAGAMVPFILTMMRHGGMRAWWLAMAAMICGGVLLGATSAEAHLHAMWILAFAGYFGVLYVGGVALRPDELHPFRWLGFAAIGVLSLVFTYGWFWQHGSLTRTSVGGIIATVVCALVLVAGVGAAVLGLMRGVPVNPFAAAFPLVALVAYSLAVLVEPWLAQLLLNLYVLGLSVTALRSGLERGRFAEANAGMLLLTALIVMRFFDTDVGFLVRGLAFIAAGAGFLLVNMILLKRRRVQA